MSNKPANPAAETTIPCSVCRKEVPLSAALTPEGADYVEHFCGIECYQQFLADAERQPPGPAQAKS